MRGYIEKYEVQQPAFQEVTTAFGAVGRFPTGRPQIRLSIVLDAALEDVDDQHFLESIQEGVRESFSMCAEVRSSGPSRTPRQRLWATTRRRLAIRGSWHAYMVSHH